MKAISILLSLTFLLAGAERAGACTIVTVADGKTVLVGNNEDHRNPHGKIWFIPATGRSHGRVCWGFDAAFEVAEGGMNDQGLFIDANSVPETGWQADPGKPSLPGSLMDYVLAHCATVDEVMVLFQGHNAMQLAHIKFPVADARGDAMIVEWGQGKLQFLKRSGRYQVSTNFVEANVAPQDITCERYQIATRILGAAGAVSLDLVRTTLAATAGELTVATVYSTICDLKHRRVFLYNFHYFDEAVTIDLDRELRRGKHGLDIPPLFHVQRYAALLFDRVRTKSGREELRKVVDTQGIEAAIAQYHKFKADPYHLIPKIDIGWGEIDALGYSLLSEGRFAEAIAVFRLNVAENPTQWAVYDSLAEAYLKNGEVDLAVENYHKSLELNPQNVNGREVLKRLEKKAPLPDPPPE
ncbi:MAG TPA: tetratricopeptide repeat protein [Candidatus Aminicenantes bacterium]|nr:tetratricopeptide repeat protein [Candidatus Aminicenantes bacterium]